MRRIALYGKGGIGKSTTSANITSALCEMGLKVMQIGCDPKSDSTTLLTGGKRIRTVLDSMRETDDIVLEDIVTMGSNGAICVECGGPRPGTGCAGRGIIAAFEILEKLGAVEKYAPDVIIYDVLGDVVCGGFAMPIRNGYAKDVFVVTSGEMMSLYAATNISHAIDNLAESGYARLGGIIQNSRNVENEDYLVDKASEEMGTSVVARIGRDPIVQVCEAKKMTVIDGAPDSDQAFAYRKLAKMLLERASDEAGGLRLAQQE